MKNGGAILAPPFLTDAKDPGLRSSDFTAVLYPTTLPGFHSPNGKPALAQPICRRCQPGENFRIDKSPAIKRRSNGIINRQQWLTATDGFIQRKTLQYSNHMCKDFEVANRPIESHGQSRGHPSLVMGDLFFCGTRFVTSASRTTPCQATYPRPDLGCILSIR